MAQIMTLLFVTVHIAVVIGMRDHNNKFPIPMPGDIPTLYIHPEIPRVEDHNLHWSPSDSPVNPTPEPQFQISDTVESIIDKVLNKEVHLQMLDESDLERARQDQYLALYGLHRQPIIGDGNCLFRSISLALYGNQDHHQELRNAAMHEIEQNFDIFRMFFFHSNGDQMTYPEIEQELNNLRQLGTFAGQESILAISRHFGINLLVTVGGDQDNQEVVTLEHDFGNSNSRIHLIWTRAGGGHYETVTETSPLDNQREPLLLRSKSNYCWNFEHSACRKFNLDTLDSLKTTDRQETNDLPTNPLMKKSADYVQTEHSYDHITDVHLEHGIFQKNQCSACMKIFHDKANLNRHMKTVHGKENSKRIPCVVPSCDLGFYHVEHLVNHLINAHEADIRVEDLEFESVNSFEEYLTRESINKNTRYVLHRQKIVNKDGSERYTLVCHRDGKKRIACDTKERKRGENKKGSCKMDGLCLSRFSVLVGTDGTVKAKYIQSHTHSTTFEDGKFLPIPDHLKSDIKTMLALKIPMNTILDKVRDKFSDRNNRNDLSDLKHYHLIDRKTIHNLKKKIIDSSVIRHSDDATSTFLRVDALRKETFDPILIFKQQNVDDSKTGLAKEDFMLAIMTKQQLDMYEKYAPVILCMDSTHKTNIYSFKLITLLVPDEFRRGYPVAFCISNKENEQAISVFLNAVKRKSPQTKVNILMTDDDNAGWNAAKNVYGLDLEHFLCIWHVHKNWRLKIQQHLKDTEQQAEIYCLLCAAMDAKTETLFNTYCDILVQRLSDINPNLLTYFNNYYLLRKEKWAMCFRKGEYSNVNTNMFLESFHNQLKTIYFEGKRNRRIDILLETLLQIENNLYFKYLAAKKFNIPSEEDLKALDRHHSSFEIHDSSVCQVNENTFSITSKKNVYTVMTQCKKCQETHCYIKCKKVPCIDLCRHIFTCNCYDYLEGNLCKHIHKIQSLLNRNTGGHTLQDQPSIHNENTTDKVISPSIKKRKCDISTSSKIQGIQERLNKIMSQIKNSPRVQEYRLDNIVTALDHIIASNDGCENLPDSLKELKRTEKISSNANNVLQPRFRSTAKNPGKKRKIPLRKPSQQEKDKVLQSINQGSQQGQGSGQTIYM